MNKLIDISYFIKNSNFQTNRELYPSDNFSKLKSTDLIFQDICNLNTQFNFFQKIQLSPHQLKTSSKYFKEDNLENITLK